MAVSTIWQRLRIEEIFLLLFSCICLFLFHFTSRGSIGIVDFLLLEAQAFTVSFNFFQGAVILAAVFFIYIYIRVFFENAVLAKKGDPMSGLKDLARKARGLARPSFFLLLGFSSLIIVLSGVTADAQGRLMSGMLLAWDKAIFGVYPFVWLHTADNPFKLLFDFLSPLTICCFQGLSLLIGATMAFFMNKRKIYPALVISFFMTTAVGLVFWWAVPANSPNNFYLSAEQSMLGYEPASSVSIFEEKVRNRQKELPPVSTFPSSHVQWGMQIVYYWAVYNRKTLFVSVPWFLLMFLGTVYLAQHYAVDILLGIPLGAISIASANFLAKRFAGARRGVEAPYCPV